MELTLQLGDASAGKPLKFRVLERTDMGDRPGNQDALTVRQFGDWVVCVLADGAGGHRGGEVASAHAVNGFLASFTKVPTLDCGELTTMVHQVNNSLLDAQQGSRHLEDMHTTLCALVLNKKAALVTWLHVGDSRVYHFRDDQVLARTKDHSLLQWMHDHHQPDASSTRNALYTALGEQAAQLQVEVSGTHAVKTGDWFLLCSDGLWEHFTDVELGLLGSNLRHDSHCAEHMHYLALVRAQGKADNLSSILVFVDDGCHSSG